jgi:hypothetical protein
MHEFTEREIGQKDTNKKEMNIKNAADPFGNVRFEGYQSHGERFDADNVHFGKIPHQNTGKRNAENKEKGKIV